MKRILIFLVLSLSVLNLCLSQVNPSPKNILDQAGMLKLSDTQRKSLNEIYIESVSRAKDLGKQIIKIEEELYEALQTGFVNEKSLADDAQQIGRLRGRLGGVFLTAHYKTQKILTSTQIEMWKKSGQGDGKK